MTTRIGLTLHPFFSFFVGMYLLTGAALAVAQTLSGRVTADNGVPFDNVAVDVLDYSGSLVGFAAFTNNNGEWNKSVPGSGTYYVRTVGSWTIGYQPEIWNNIPCDGCDPVINGTAIVVADIDVGSIDFALAPLLSAPCNEVILRGGFEEQGSELSCQALSLRAGEGGFVSYSANRQCLEAQRCLLGTDLLGMQQVTFDAHPRSGYTFLGWKAGDDHLCAGQISSCVLDFVNLGDPPSGEWRLSPSFAPDGSFYFPFKGQQNSCRYVEPNFTQAVQCELKDFTDYGYGPLSGFKLTTDLFFIDYDQRKAELAQLAEPLRNEMCNANRFDGVFNYADYTPTPAPNPVEDYYPPAPGIFEPLVFGRVHYTLLENEEAGKMIRRSLLKWAEHEVDLSWVLPEPGWAGAAHYDLGLLMPAYVMAWDAIRDADFVSSLDRKKIDSYLHDLMVFLAQRPGHENDEFIGETYVCPNPCGWGNDEVFNHAWSQDLGLMTYAVITGNDTLFQRGVRRYFAILDGIIRPDGSHFNESQRGGSALQYSIGATSTLIRIAELAAIQGYDLYSVEIDGKSLHTIIDFHLSAIEDETLIHPYAQSVEQNPGYCEEDSCRNSWNSQFFSEDNPGGWRRTASWMEFDVYRQRFPNSPFVGRYLAMYPDENYINWAEGIFSQTCEFRDISNLIQ
jgi:hypothetical protein